MEESRGPQKKGAPSFLHSKDLCGLTQALVRSREQMVWQCRHMWGCVHFIVSSRTARVVGGKQQSILPHRGRRTELIHTDAELWAGLLVC